MLEIIYRLAGEWTEQERAGVMRLNSVRELEDWLAYNRAYVIELEFSGTISDDSHADDGDYL